MKNSFCVVLFCCFLLQGFGQSQTLFNDADIYGGFGGPIIEFSGFNGDVITSIGGGGGVFLDNVFIGGYGMGSLEMRDPSVEQENFKMNLGHGGFWLGYAKNQYKLTHLFASTKLGWGSIDVDFDGPGSKPSDNVFVISPEVGLEVNLFRWFKIGGTVGYRLVTGVNEIDTHSNSDFNSVTGGLVFRFGWFER
ncbi:MAG: hypothetical protein AAF573_10500 [Bacteroidota bacterium]